MKLKTTLSILAIFAVSLVFAQELDWRAYVEQQCKQKQNPTIFTAKKAFDDYFERYPEQRVKGQGISTFEREFYYWKSRVLPNKEVPPANILWQAWEEYKSTHRDYFSYVTKKRNANWQTMGPYQATGGYWGKGRINCISFHPTDPNTLYVGTPSGGLWKSTNGGVNWSTNTDDMPVLGVSSIAINPLNPNTIYIATGDKDGGSLHGLTGSTYGDTKTIGILKSTDGGQTWDPTGFSQQVNQGRIVSKVLTFAQDTNIVIHVGSMGIYKSTDGGNSFAIKQTGLFSDIEVHPTNPDVMYASERWTSDCNIFRTIDGGETWNQVTNFTGVYHIELAVTPALPNRVYAITVNSSRGMEGFYVSDLMGQSFNKMSINQNLLHSSVDGNGIGGQGTYDLALAASPTDGNIVLVGGVNTWKSTNGGSSWTINTYWNPNTSVQAVHADKHYFAYHPLQPNKLFDCNDGGLYYTVNDGNSWIESSDDIVNSQIYRLAVPEQNVDQVLIGLQDNGTMGYFGATPWVNIDGGDGMNCEIDYTNANNYYAGIQYGVIDRFINKNWNSRITDNISNKPRGAWVSPYFINPNDPNKLVLALSNKLFFSNNKGDSWSEKQTDFSIDIERLECAPSNPDVLYAATMTDLAKSTDNGDTWVNIKNNLPIGDSPYTPLTYIHVHPTNPQKVWVTIGRYLDGQKVFVTENGGASWTDISGTLPNVPANCVTFDKNSANEALYVGTDLGVYYKDNTLADWVPWNDGLPNVVVTELEIHYAANKIVAATFGRGAWESDLEVPGATVIANFTADSTNICPGGNVQFTNTSVGDNLSYQWTFTGGTPSSSSAENPQITYNTPGNYLVSLSISNSDGNDIKTVNGYITVNDLPNVQLGPIASNDKVCENEALVNLNSGSPTGGTYTGTGVSGNSFNPDGLSTGNYTITYTYTSAQGCTNSDSRVVEILEKPSVSMSSIVPNDSICPKHGDVNLTMGTPSGGTYSGSGVSGNNFNPEQLSAGDFTIVYTYTASNGCTNTATQQIKVLETPSVTLANINTNNTFCENDQVYTLTSGSPTGGTYSGQGVTNGSFNPAVGQGMYTVTYTYVNGEGCSNSATKDIFVNAVPSVSFASINQNKPLCDNGTPIQLTTGSPSGGIYNGTGVSNNSFNPNGLSADTYTLNYVYTSQEGCTGDASQTIEVVEAPNVTLNLTPASVCAYENPFPLNGGEPEGGLYIGNGVSNNYFDPMAVSAGSHLITYTYTDNNNCSNYDEFELLVNDAPNVDFSAITESGKICNDASPITLTTGSPTGGTYLGQGVANGQFNPVGLAERVYTLAYGFTDLNNCADTAYQNIEIINCSGIVEKGVFSEVKIYPNPTKSVLTLENLESNTQIIIFNILGEKVYERFNVLSKENINVESFTKGVYTLKLIQATEHITTTVVIQ